MRVQVERLAKGMFVQDLDRPWTDTPFLLQGFQIEADEDLAMLRTHCKYVIVDATRSTPESLEGFSIPKAAKVAAPQREVVSRSQVTVIHGAEAGTQKKQGGSLLGDLKTIVKETLNTKEDGAGPAHSADHSGLITSRERGLPKVRRAPAAPTGAETEEEEPAADGVRREQAIIHKEQPAGKKGGLFKQFGSLFGRKEEEPPAEPEPPVARVRQINVAPPLLVVESGKIMPSRELQEARKTRETVREAVKTVIEDIRKERKIDLEKINEAVDSMVENVSKSPDALIWLTRLKNRDSYAYDHGIDVSIYMLSFGRHLGYSRTDMHALGMAGLLLDVGKLRMPMELLEKRSRLSPAEFEFMKSHVTESLSIVKDTANVPAQVTQIVAQHHERIDGSGYPDKLSGHGISLFGAMAAIVDCFEAITSDRPYATAVSTHQALQNLNGWKTKLFHEGLVEQFMQCVGVFPVGSLVELTTGDVGIVTAQNKIRRLRPKVMLVLDASKRPQQFPVMLDLMNDPLAPDGSVYAIKKDLPVGMYGIDAREYYL
jgi:HD-GYP domain-containing protein (c-di-GMP phosphodiesterase class II)